MILKITKWLVLIIVFKMITVWLIAQFYTDPRRDIDAREKLCNAFKPNTVFIGTSRTLYGIDPALFDSLNHQRTHSYNFGIFSLSPQISFNVAENLIANDPAVKTIFIELSALDYSTVALKPVDVFQDVAFRANVMAGSSNFDAHDKATSFFQALNTTLFQMFSIAPQITTAKKVISPISDPVEGKPELQDNGHQSVAKALSLSNDRIVNNRIATQQMLAQHPSADPNTYYISRINQLIGQAKRAGKQVLFFYPNSLTKVECLILSQVAPNMLEENLIRLPEDQQLDDFFKPKNLFDPHHLNQKGAAIYTRFLQKESLKRFDHFNANH
jgi:hypothetical protein